LIALSIGWRLIVSKVRDAPPFANENPAVPGPSDESLYDAAAKPDGTHGFGDGEGDGDGEGAVVAVAPGFAGGAGGGDGAVCASAGTAHSAHAAKNAAAGKFKPPPNGGK
jgi:hypothetical protein